MKFENPNLQIFLNNDVSDAINHENFLENELISQLIEVYYNQLDDNTKKNYRFDIFKEDLLKLFVKKKPTQAVAESYELETWLDSSRRVNLEKRFAAYKKLLIKELRVCYLHLVT